MNYNIIVDTSNFKPYDITPALAMLRDYRDAYYRIEDQFNKIAEERGKLMLSQQDSPDAYNKLQDYDQSFSDFVKDFSHGMNLQNAAWARQLRGQYSKDILPIKEAVDRYNKIQDQVSRLGPDAIYVNGVPSFDSIYKNGALNQALQYRSEKTEKDSAQKYFSGIFNALANNNAPEFQALTDAAEGYLFRHQNASLQEAYSVALAGLNSQDPNNNISKAYAQYLNNLGISEYTEEAQQKIKNAVMTGLVSAIPAQRQDIYSDLTLNRNIARNTETRNQERHESEQEARDRQETADRIEIAKKQREDAVEQKAFNDAYEYEYYGGDDGYRYRQIVGIKDAEAAKKYEETYGPGRRSTPSASPTNNSNNKKPFNDMTPDEKNSFYQNLIQEANGQISSGGIPITIANSSSTYGTAADNPKIITKNGQTFAVFDYDKNQYVVPIDGKPSKNLRIDEEMFKKIERGEIGYKSVPRT